MENPTTSVRNKKNSSKNSCWNQSQGKAGEAHAEVFLKEQGYEILTRRYRNQFGEIDLVARRNDTLLFIEVKTRSNPEFGDPLQAVSPRKISHLRKAVCGFLLEHPEYQKNYFWELAAIAVRLYEETPKIDMVKILP